MEKKYYVHWKKINHPGKKIIRLSGPLVLLVLLVLACKNCAGNLNEDDIWISHPSFPEEATSPQVLPSVPSNYGYGLEWEGWSFEPAPNAGAGDCFWLALAPEVGSPEHARNVVASWLLEHHDHPATTDADDIREGALTSEWHVNATVQAYQGRFPATLHFSQYTSSFRVEIPCLLYTHASTDATGHFECWSPGKRG